MTSATLNYLRSLDGIRGIAILLVLALHQQILHFGWVGVQLFFVLSGFLITQILLLEKEKSISVRQKLKNFWMRRVLRIFPIYYLYILVLLIIWLAMDNNHSFINSLPFLLTYTYNFHLSSTLDFSGLPIIHLWSLSVEEQFYLLYPLSILFVPKKRVKVFTIALIIFSVCFRFIYYQYMEANTAGNTENLYEKIHYLTFTHFDSFLAGGCIAIFNLYNARVRIQSFLFAFSWLLLVVSGLVIYFKIHSEPFCIACFLTRLGYEPESLNFQWTYLVLNFFFFTIMLLLVSKQAGLLNNLLTKIFSSSLLVEIGKVSYGMYVIHLGVSYLMNYYIEKYGFTVNKHLAFIPYVILVYSIAMLSFRFFEKKFLVLKKNFR